MIDPHTAMLRPATKKPIRTGRFSIRSTGFIEFTAYHADGEVKKVGDCYIARVHRSKITPDIKDKIARCCGLMNVDFEIEEVDDGTDI